MQKEMKILWAKRLPLTKDPVVLYALCESKMLFKETLIQDNTVQAYLERLEEIPGFDEFFVANEGCVSKQQVADKFGKECAEWIFTMPECSTQTALFIKDEYLLGRELRSRVLGKPILRQDSDTLSSRQIVRSITSCYGTGRMIIVIYAICSMGILIASGLFPIRQGNIMQLMSVAIATKVRWLNRMRIYYAAWSCWKTWDILCDIKSVQSRIHPGLPFVR